MFTTITLNSFLGTLLISTSLSFSTGVFSFLHLGPIPLLSHFASLSAIADCVPQAAML